MQYRNQSPIHVSADVWVNAEKLGLGIYRYSMDQLDEKQRDLVGAYLAASRHNAAAESRGLKTASVANGKKLLLSLFPEIAEDYRLHAVVSRPENP